MKHILRCTAILAALALGFSLNSCENNVTVNATPGETAAATKTLTLTGICIDLNTGDEKTKSLEIEYTDNDTWKDIAERYDEVSLYDRGVGTPEGKIVLFWHESEEDYGCELKSNESTYQYKLVGINDKVSAYSSSSYYLEE
jgi:hypothetical protein